MSAGFVHAPVMKALFYTTTGSSILWQAARLDLVEPLHPIVRTFVQSFVFRNTGEMFFGVGLLYNLRLLERRTGSAKFAAYTTVVATMCHGLNAAMQMAYGFKNIPSGPYGFLFASFVPFIFDIPPSRKFTLFGIPFSDKTFTYLMGLQLFFSNGSGSMIAALCGVLTGFTYRSKVLNIHKFRFPKILCRLVARTIGRLVGANSPRPVVMTHTLRNVRRRGHHLNHNGTAGGSQNRVAVSDNAVRQLVLMGFNEDQAKRALRATENDLQSAIAMLVDQA